MAGWSLLQAIKGDIRLAISRKAKLDSAYAFVGRVVVRVQAEGDPPDEVVFNMPRGCGMKIEEQETAPQEATAEKKRLEMAVRDDNRSDPKRLHLECIDWPDREKGYQPEFDKIEGQTFETKRVHGDNYQYGNCRFVICTFVYSGGPFGFHECKLEGNFSLALTGSARRAAELWQVFREYDKTIPKPL
jgi:hypothetical protein